MYQNFDSPMSSNITDPQTKSVKSSVCASIMKSVLLFKTESVEYKLAFSSCEYNTVFVEPLQFEYINTEDLCRELLRTDYNGLIFTSQRAVEAVAKCWGPTNYALWNSKKIYTVGETSRSKIKLLLGVDADGALSGNADELSQFILSENSEGCRFLFPCGNLKSESIPTVLRSKGIEITSLTIYETKENLNLRLHLSEQNCKDICCLVFFSPSGCGYVYKQLESLDNTLSKLPPFAIGKSTASKLISLGLQPAGVASHPTPESVLESVEKYFQAKTS